MDDDLLLPSFLDRKVNGVSSEEPANVRVRARKLIWPKKRNWRKIEQRRREREKREHGALLLKSIRPLKGQ